MKLNGDGIYLRYLEVQDAAARLEFYRNNRDFFDRYSGTRPDDFYTLDYQQEAITSGLASQQDDEDYFFGVFLANSDTLIGTVSLTEVIRGPVQAAWIGYSMDQAHNGQGYATQAVQLVTDYAFRELKLHRLEAGVMPHNAASLRVLAKAGYAEEGLMRQNLLINGQWEDHLHLAIINPND